MKRASSTSRRPASRREIFITFAGLIMVLTLAALDQNIVSTALPRIVGDLGGLTHLSWVVTAFMLTSTSSTLLYGKLSDMYGRKPLFYTGIVIFLIGSTLCGLAQSMTQLIIFRGLQGLGAGGLITLSQTTVGDLIPPRERGRYQGIFGGVFATCSVAGPLLGGFITDALSWRWIFYVNLPLGLIAMALIAVGLHRHNRPVNHRIDYFGAFYLTGGTTCLLLFLSWGGSLAPWSSPLILFLAAMVAAFYGLLIYHERRAPEPVLPLRLFANKVFVIAVSVIGLTGMALMGSLVFMPLFFQLVMGASPSRAGLLMSPMMGGMIVASVLGGRMISRIGRYKIFPVIGLILASSVFYTMSWAARTHVALPIVEVLLITLGLGLGLVMPNLIVALQNSVQNGEMGVATSASSFFRSLGGAVGVSAAGALVTWELHRLLPGSFFEGNGTHSLLDQGIQRIAQLGPEQHDQVLEAFRAATSTTFLAGGIIVTLSLITVLFLPERPLRGSRIEAEAEASGTPDVLKDPVNPIA